MAVKHLFDPNLFDGPQLFDTGLRLVVLADLFVQLGEPEARWFSDESGGAWETDEAAIAWAAEALPLAWLCSSVFKDSTIQKKC